MCVASIHFCRLRPVVGGNIRALDSPIVLNGYKIPKGVSYCSTFCIIVLLKLISKSAMAEARIICIRERVLRGARDLVPYACR